MNEWAVAYKDQGLGHGMYGVVVKDTNEVLFEDIPKEKCEEIVRRWNSQPDLLEACKKAYKEGYADGYRDGIEADESCVEETTIFKNDFTKAWKRSEAKAAIAKGSIQAISRGE